MKGKFIVLEGPEGGGKTTQKGLLHNYLVKQSYSVFETREPGGTEISEAIRELLLDPKYKGIIFPKTELFLYEAVRAQLTGEVIEPKLKVRVSLSKGTIGLTDRCFDASTVYQGIARGLDIDLIEIMNKYAMNGIIPDITFIYDVPVEIGLKRAKGNTAGDRMEQEDTIFHEKVRMGYLSLPNLSPHRRIQIIDGTKSIDDVFKETKKYIDEIL